MTASEQDTVTAPSVEPRGESMKERGGVQSIERAFTILEEVASHRDGIRLGELSRKVGLHTSTTFHLVKTMLMLGYLRQMPDDKTYRIGTPLFRLAASALDELEMATLAKPILEALSRRTPARPATSRCAPATTSSCWRAPSAPARSRLSDRVGGGAARRIARRSARSCWRRCSEEQLEAYLARRPLAPLTRQDHHGPGAAASARSPPFARAGLPTTMVNTARRRAAWPFRCKDFTGEVRVAIGISGAVWRLSLQALEEKSRFVREAADLMSARVRLSCPDRRRSAAPATKRRARKRPQPLSISLLTAGG